jgi:hypothetical protein
MPHTEKITDYYEGWSPEKREEINQESIKNYIEHVDSVNFRDVIAP